jgi:hypothetical protein
MNCAPSDLNPRDGLNYWTEDHIGSSYCCNKEMEQMNARLLAEIRTEKKDGNQPRKDGSQGKQRAT